MRLQRLPACRPSRKLSATVVAPSSVTTRCPGAQGSPLPRRPVSWSATQRPVETSPGPTLRKMDRTDPEGQWYPSSRPLEACNESWSPRSNATTPAGYAITTTTTTHPVSQSPTQLCSIWHPRASASVSNYLLLSLKVDAHFTVPWRVEGWVQL